MNDSAHILVPQHFGSIVFQRLSSRFLPFDEAATRLLTALIQAPPALLAPELGALETLEPFLETLFSEGFLRPDGRFAGTRLDLVPPEGHLTGPLAVHLEVSGACNLSCKHCFAGDLPRLEPRRPPLSLDALSVLFADLAAIGAFRLGLTGGEPLLNSALFELVDEARLQGLHPCLTTNGLLIDEPIAKQLGRREFMWLNVSLDGASAQTNDAVRGAGVFDKVLAGLKILERHAPFTLSFTVTRQNAHEVETCAALAREVGAQRAVFRPLYPAGVALDHPELTPSYDDYSQALRRLEGSVGSTVLCQIDPFTPRLRAPSRTKLIDYGGCGAGALSASISVDGRVSPCSFLGEDWYGDDLRLTPFREIWDRSPAFQRMRHTKGEFLGGCRARARAATGSVFGADPWHDCWLEESRRSLYVGP